MKTETTPIETLEEPFPTWEQIACMCIGGALVTAIFLLCIFIYMTRGQPWLI